MRRPICNNTYPISYHSRRRVLQGGAGPGRPPCASLRRMTSRVGSREATGPTAVPPSGREGPECIPVAIAQTHEDIAPAAAAGLAAVVRERHGQGRGAVLG